MRGKCEKCGVVHSYPGTDYYDLCRKCALEEELEVEEYDFRLGDEAFQIGEEG